MIELFSAYSIYNLFSAAERPPLSRQNSGASTSSALSSTVAIDTVTSAAARGSDEKARRAAAREILGLLCETPILSIHLLPLLSAK